MLPFPASCTSLISNAFAPDNIFGRHSTAEATSQLAKRLRGENLGGLDYVCMLGLLSSPDSEAARRALERELADPDHPISDIFINTLRSLYLDVGDPHQD